MQTQSLSSKITRGDWDRYEYGCQYRGWMDGCPLDGHTCGYRKWTEMCGCHKILTHALCMIIVLVLLSYPYST